MNDILSWRGKFLRSGKDQNNKKYISMNGDKSELYIPIQIEENTTYKIKMELRKESGNGIIHCDVFGNKSFNFGDVNKICDNSSWEIFEFFVTTKTFPKTLSFYFRILREDGVGEINVADISVEKVYIIENENNSIEETKTNKVIENVIVEEKVIEEIKKVEDIKTIEERKMDKNLEKILSSKKSEPDKIFIYDEKELDINFCDFIEQNKNYYNNVEIIKNRKEIILKTKLPKKLEIEDNNKIYIFSPYYIEECKKRQEEIDDCLFNNIKNEFISKIFLFSNVEEINEDIMCNKVEINYNKNWTTYNEIIEYINNNERFYNSYNIILNTDMYCDNTISLLHNFDLSNSCVALSVWQENLDKILNESSAQGAWIFKGHINPFNYIIPMGKPGCDNRILFELFLKKYILYNICYDIKIIHKHLSSERKYTQNERIPRPYVMLWSNKK